MGLMRNKNLETEYLKALEDIGLDIELDILNEEATDSDKDKDENKE